MLEEGIRGTGGKEEGYTWGWLQEKARGGVRDSHPRFIDSYPSSVKQLGRHLLGEQARN